MQQWRSHEGGTCPHNPNPARPWDSPRSEENFFVWGYGVLPDGPLTPVGPTQPKMWVITLERIGLQFVLSVRRSFIYDNWWSAAQFYLHVWITFLMSVPSECIILTQPFFNCEAMAHTFRLRPRLGSKPTPKPEVMRPRGQSVRLSQDGQQKHVNLN